MRATHGLVNSTQPVYNSEEVSKGRKLHTAYVTFGSSLIGRRISETSLEADHKMVLVAVARQGERVNSSPHEVELRAGDTLLLESGSLAAPKTGRDLQFFDSEIIPNIGWRTLLSSLIMLGIPLTFCVALMVAVSR